MPAQSSIEKLPNGEVVRFKTSRFGLAVARQKNGDGIYSKNFHYTKMVGGRVVRFPVGYSVRDAERLAEEIAGFLSDPRNTLDMAISRYNPRRTSRHNEVATFEEVLTAYENALGVIGRKGQAVSKNTFKGYKSSLLTILRRVEAYRKGKEFESFMGKREIDFGPWLKMTVDVLTPKFVWDLKLASMPPPPEGEEEPDEDEALTAKISCDSMLRCARAIFGKQAMRYYKEAKLNVPNISEFLSEPGFSAKKYFQLLPPNVIVEIMRQSIALRVADVDAFRAYLLTTHCGLRRGEALAFKPSWLREEDRPMLYVTAKGTFNPKHGHGRKVAIEKWVFDTLTELGPVQSADSLTRLNEWVKGIIPKEHSVGKPIHELRKLWVSQKAKFEGILAAAQQAGHNDPRTTSTHYADNMMPDKLLPLWKEPTEAAIIKFDAA